MKNRILLVLLFVWNLGFGQSFKVTPNGIESASDSSKNYIVITVDSLSALQLYQNAIAYINLNIDYPLEAVTRQVEGETLEFNVPRQNVYIHSGIDVYAIEYKACLSFRDKQVKYEIRNFSMSNINLYGVWPIEFIGSYQTNGLYNKKGELKKKDFKKNIEQHLQEQLKIFTDYLKGIRDKDPDNWWS